MGMNRHFPNAVYRGMPRYGGLAVAPLSTHQGYKQLQLLVGSVRNGDSGGDMVIQSQEYLQLEAGISTSILNPQQHDKHAVWLTKTWLTSVRQFLLQCDGKIIFTKEWTPCIQREHDTFIMPELAKYTDNENKLHQLNRCRMYLKVITLSDITNSTGKALCKYAQKGEEHPDRFSTKHWPTQHNLHPKYWQQWRAAIKEAFCTAGTQKLKKKLGKWYTSHPQSQIWDTFADPLTGDLICTTEDEHHTIYTRFPVQKIGAKLYYSKTTGNATEKPPQLIRISLHSQSPLSWVFTKGSEETKTTTIFANKQKPTLKIIERIQGPVHHDINWKKLVPALKSGN